MKTLHLNLHRKWFDMIASGDKKEEYRDIKDYWIIRLDKAKKHRVKTVTFANGMRKDRRIMTVELKDIVMSEGKPEWGADKGVFYYVIKLGKVISKNF